MCPAPNTVILAVSDTTTVAATAPQPRNSPPFDARYPAHRAADVVLADGATIQIRPVRPSDCPSLTDFYHRWPADSLVLRFFSAGLDVAQLVQRFCTIDYHDEFGLIAVAGPDQRLVAHASYSRTSPTQAEVAFGVADDHQGRSLATLLLGHLAEAAAASGIAEFVADVLPRNHRMVGVLRDSGFPVQVQTTSDALRITLPTSLTARAIERFDQREQLAAVAALRAFLEPRAVAVIGASRKRGTASKPSRRASSTKPMPARCGSVCSDTTRWPARRPRWRPVSPPPPSPRMSALQTVSLLARYGSSSSRWSPLASR